MTVSRGRLHDIVRNDSAEEDCMGLAAGITHDCRYKVAAAC